MGDWRGIDLRQRVAAIRRPAQTCRSEPARDGHEGGAFYQEARVIVNAHRRQAGSYSWNAFSCRSEPAREKLSGGAFIQAARVFVNAHREQARSYR
jgi:hypothetical protein